MNNTKYDVIVVGGGVNGCGIARDAVLRGLKTMLVEKNDFSSGTSWASSGMIHGGARYMLNDIKTTKKSCQDSGYIQKIVPHLIFRIPFLVPTPKTGIKPYDWFMLEATKTYFETYDVFQPLKGGKPSLKFSPEEVRKLEPLLQADIQGAVTMDEYGIDVPRLCMLNALDAKERGATVYNHAEVTELIKEGQRVTGVRIRHKNGRIETAEASVVVNAGGPWATGIGRMAGADVKLRPAKGIHIIYPGRLSNFAILTPTIDKRSIFIMPHENTTMVGTTDDDYYGDPDDIPILWDEVRYLIQGIASMVPAVRNLRPMRVIAGLRPTLYEYGPYEDALSRDHRVIDHAVDDGVEGLVSLIGGKLAAYREMAEDCTDAVMNKLGKKFACQTHKLALPGGDATPDARALAEQYGQPLAVTRRLAFRHGSRAERVLELMKQQPAWARLVDATDPVSEAELRYCIRNEMVQTLGDLSFRTKLGDGPFQGTRDIFPAGVILGQELGLSPEEVRQEVRNWFQKRWREWHPVAKGSMAQSIQFNYSHADLITRAEAHT